MEGKWKDKYTSDLRVVDDSNNEFNEMLKNESATKHVKRLFVTSAVLYVVEFFAIFIFICLPDDRGGQTGHLPEKERFVLMINSVSTYSLYSIFNLKKRISSSLSMFNSFSSPILDRRNGW